MTIDGTVADLTWETAGQREYSPVWVRDLCMCHLVIIISFFDKDNRLVFRNRS